MDEKTKGTPRAIAMMDTLQRLKEQLEQQREHTRSAWLERLRRAAYDDAHPIGNNDAIDMDNMRREFDLAQVRVATVDLVWNAMVEVYETWDETKRARDLPSAPVDFRQREQRLDREEREQREGEQEQREG